MESIFSNGFETNFQNVYFQLPENGDGMSFFFVWLIGSKTNLSLSTKLMDNDNDGQNGILPRMKQATDQLIKS